MQKAREEREAGRSGNGGEGETVMGLPLPIPLLLKCDISEAAGDPKEVENKWQPVGSRGRGETDRRHRQLGRVNWGVQVERK